VLIRPGVGQPVGSYRLHYARKPVSALLSLKGKKEVQAIAEARMFVALDVFRMMISP
jgi:hypothetical protein